LNHRPPRLRLRVTDCPMILQVLPDHLIRDPQSLLSRPSRPSRPKDGSTLSDVRSLGVVNGSRDLRARSIKPFGRFILGRPLRYRENLPDGSKKMRSVAIGTVEEFLTESRARKAALSWLLSITVEPSNGMPVSFGAVIQRYLAEEIPERPSTASRHRCWLKNYIEPKWRDYPIEQIKPLLHSAD